MFSIHRQIEVRIGSLSFGSAIHTNHGDRLNSGILLRSKSILYLAYKVGPCLSHPLEPLQPYCEIWSGISLQILHCTKPFPPVVTVSSFTSTELN
jgi:hypothetical protein